MRGILPTLFLVASLPVVAWEAPTFAEMAAVQGAEPYATALEAGIPLPIPRGEAVKSAGWRYGLERLALKRALVYRTSRGKAERNRITPEINRATASLARQAGAPELCCRYLEMLADDSLSRRQQYAVNQALNYMLQETYGIDTLQIRLVSESLALPPAEHTQYMLRMPVGGMYDMIPHGKLPAGQFLADIQLMTWCLRRAGEELGKVHDRETAETAALALQTLLPLWNTTLRTQLFLHQGGGYSSPAEKLALQLLHDTLKRLVETRKQLLSAQWYGASCLQAVDELLR